MTNLSEFAAQHWMIGGTAASLLWFIMAKQDSRSHGRWMSLSGIAVAVAIIVRMAAWAVRNSEWIGIIAAIPVLLLELWEGRRIWNSRTGSVVDASGSNLR